MRAILFGSLFATWITASAMIGCGANAPPAPLPPAGVNASSLTVTSKSFASKGPMPVDSSCDGSDKSPQLTWSAPPEGTKTLALIVEDPDAPAGVFTHWIVFNLPPETSSLAEAVDPATLAGAKVGLNDFKNVRYGGPCPPRREIHRYVFHVYALDIELPSPDGATKEVLYGAMNGHVIGEGYVIGTFSR